MAIVSEIRESRGLIEIQTDGATFARVREAHFQKCPLNPGDEIDENYLQRVASIQFAEGYEAALTQLDYCARTRTELSDALRRKGYVEPAVDAILARLSENGLIDDARYARRMAELQSKKPVGVYAFRRKLRAKGISEEDAEAALEAFDDAQQQDAALAEAQRLYRKYEALPARQARAKLSQALARKGFPWDAISMALDQLTDDPEE